MINYLITHLTFIYRGWITLPADFLCILATHTSVERLLRLPFLISDPFIKAASEKGFTPSQFYSYIYVSVE